MQAVFNQKELDKGLSAAKRATMAKGSIAVLSGILIEAAGDRAIFSATNYDTSIQYTIPAQIALPGKVLVSGNLLHDLVKRMSGQDITLKTDETYLNVRSGAAEYKIVTMDPTKFPLIDHLQADSLGLSNDDLRSIHRCTAFAVSKDAVAKPVFSGINLKCGENALVATGTDSFRLARKIIPFSSEVRGDAIIPPDAIAEVIRLTGDDEGISLLWGKGKVGFETSNLYFSCRTIDKTFPNIERVIPQNLPTILTIKRGELEQAIERLTLIAMERIEKCTSNTMCFTVQDNLLIITASGADKGQAKEEISTTTEGPAISLNFNGSQILECLRALDSDMVEISLPAKIGAATIIGQEDDGFLYVITTIGTAKGAN